MSSQSSLLRIAPLALLALILPSATPAFAQAAPNSAAPALAAALPLQVTAQLSAPAAASTPLAAPASFEVASVRVLPPGAYKELQDDVSLMTTSTYPTMHFFMHYATLPRLVLQAYGIGAQKYPDWSLSELYDVEATVGGDRPLTREETQPLLQNLLAQRLNLKIHYESRTVSGYELVAAKDGVKLTPAKESSRPKDIPSNIHAAIGPSQFDAWGTSIDSFAKLLGGPVGKPVIDKTGLTGSYDIHFTFAPSDDPKSPLPDIFTAVQEQIGLKLVPAKVPVDYLVIDHVDRIPTEN